MENPLNKKTVTVKALTVSHSKMAAPGADVLVFFLVLFALFQVKKASFITPDGISCTLNAEEVYNSRYDTHICSGLWINKKKHITPTNSMSKNLLFMLLLTSGDVEVQPGPELNAFLHKSGFKVLHHNVNGIPTKIESIRLFLEHKNIHIFGVTETHLTNSFTDDEVSVDGYNLERLDRKCEVYGGVICYIREDLSYERRKDLEIEGIEAIWVEIFPKKSHSFLLSFMYRPPDSSEYIDPNFVEKLETMIQTANYENKEAIVAGDLNCDYLIADNHKNIKSIFKLNGFKQLINEPTRITDGTKTLIDVIYSNNVKKIAESIVIPSAISDHDIIGISRKLHTEKFQPRKTLSRNFSKYQPDKFRNDIKSVNWKNALHDKDFNSAWHYFKNILCEIVNKNAPRKEKMVRGKPAPWLTYELKNQMNHRDYYLKKARKSKSPSDWKEYRRIRNQVTYNIRQAKSSYCQNMILENERKPSDFWRCVKKIFPAKSKKGNLPTMMNVNGRKECDKPSIANSFCHFFSNIGSKLQLKIPSVKNRIWKTFSNSNLWKNSMHKCEFKFKTVYPTTIEKLLKKLKTKKSSGPDQIPASMLRDAAKKNSLFRYRT